VLKIGVFGGTFDPIHIGHVVAANTARKQLDLDIVLFVPCWESPLKASSRPVAARHRLAMVKIGTKRENHFSVSGIEVEREGISYTVETVRDLKGHYRSDAKLYLMVGSDAFKDMHRWRDPERIAEMCDIVVILRPGVEDGIVDREIKARSQQQVDPITITGPTVGLSATELRRKIYKGEPVKHLLPLGVGDYIKNNKLYEDSENSQEGRIGR